TEPTSLSTYTTDSAISILPDTVPYRVQLEDPVVVAWEKIARTMRSPAAGSACYYETTIRGQLYRACLIIVGSAVCLLPYQTARGVKFEDQGVPVVSVAGRTTALNPAGHDESTVRGLSYRRSIITNS